MGTIYTFPRYFFLLDYMLPSSFGTSSQNLISRLTFFGYILLYTVCQGALNHSPLGYCEPFIGVLLNVYHGTDNLFLPSLNGHSVVSLGDLAWWGHEMWYKSRYRLKPYLLEHVGTLLKGIWESRVRTVNKSSHAMSQKDTTRGTSLGDFKHCDFKHGCLSGEWWHCNGYCLALVDIPGTHCDF